jgi:hypothetical protein
VIGRRGHVGWEVRCDAHGCDATTATLVPPPFRRSPERALEAARACAWIHTTVDGQTRWACPLHQTWEQRLGRWVITPLAIRR